HRGCMSGPRGGEGCTADQYIARRDPRWVMSDDARRAHLLSETGQGPSTDLAPQPYQTQPGPIGLPRLTPARGVTPGALRGSLAPRGGAGRTRRPARTAARTARGPALAQPGGMARDARLPRPGRRAHRGPGARPARAGRRAAPELLPGLRGRGRLPHTGAGQRALE